MNDVDAILITAGTISKGILICVGLFLLILVLFSLLLFLSFVLAQITTWIQIRILKFIYDTQIFLSTDRTEINKLFIKKDKVDRNKILLIQTGIYSLLLIFLLYIIYDLKILTIQI